MPHARRTVIFYVVLVVLAAAVPALGEVYYTRLATQVAILAMVALSVDLLIGYAGLLTFGQAAFFGMGAYVTGVLTVNGVTSAFLVWPLAVAAAALCALVIGALALRTSGFQFIMVTLAFAQMIYYFWLSQRQLGGENGFPLPARNTFGGLLDIENHATFYYLVLALLIIVVAVALRIVGSRFGMVIQGGRDNLRRLAAIGFPPFRYRLAAFCISGAIAGLAGALLANHTTHVSTELLSWQQSGNFLAMVILGSSGTLIGPVFGAAVFVFFQQIVSDWTQHWLLFFGVLIVVRILLIKGSLADLLTRRGRAPPQGSAAQALPPPATADAEAVR